MDQMDHQGSGGVILETRPKKRPSLILYWFFTFNNYMDHLDQMDHLLLVLRHECDWFVFQEETGESGTPHLQGTLKLKYRKRLSGMKKLNSKIHWEPTKCVTKSIAYATKQETRSGQQWTYNLQIEEIVTPCRPYGWQLEVLDIVKGPRAKRLIHWFWESKGSVGKSDLSIYLYLKHNALLVSGKSTDMFHQLAKYPDRRKVIIVDVPRDVQRYVNYGALEMIKNGFVHSGKYKGSQICFVPPHVIVFANQPPALQRMSTDRWHVVNINNADVGTEIAATQGFADDFVDSYDM